MSAKSSPIKHVVIIVKENHGYDNYFGTFPGGNGVALPPSANPPPKDPDHRHAAWLTRDTKALRVAFPQSDIPHYWGYAQQFTTDDLCDRVLSTSYVAALPLVDREELMVRVRALTHGLAEPFPFPYETEVHVIPRSSDRDDFTRGTSNEG